MLLIEDKPGSKALVHMKAKFTYEYQTLDAIFSWNALTSLIKLQALNPLNIRQKQMQSKNKL